MPKIEGRCLCGDVRYTSAAEPVVVALCHCTHCQRQSGGAFSVNVGVPKGALTVLSTCWPSRESAGLPARNVDMKPTPRRSPDAADKPISSAGYRFPPEVIRYAVWLYFPFSR